MRFLINNDMKKAQVEYDSKGKNGSWDTNRLVREYIGIALMTNDSISRKDFIFSSSRKASALSCSFFFFSDSLFRKATRSQRLEQYLQVILLATNSFPQTPHTLIILIFTCSFGLIRSSILSQTVSYILSIYPSSG